MTWIVPKNSPISASAQDMMELEKDSNLLASTLASTFLWRSKPTQERVWSQRLKKVSWLQAFSTRILKPSLSEGFEERLISFLPDSHASRLVRPDSGEQTTTQDTSGHSSVTELMLADLPLFCSKMLTELSQHDLEGMTGQTQRERPFCSMSLENWKDWVTEQRQDASQRQKLAHHTNASDGSSWPTASSRDHKDCSDPRTWNCKESRVRNDQLARAVYFAADGHPDRDSHSLNGNLHGFANFPTPRTSDYKSTPGAEQNQKRLESGKACLSEHVHATADWLTPRTLEVDEPYEQYRARMMASGNPKNIGKTNPANLSMQVGMAQWGTPSSSDYKKASVMGEANSQQLSLSRTVAQHMINWQTARMSDAEGGPIQTEMTDDGFRSYRANSGQWFGAKLRDAAETHEKHWATPRVSMAQDKQEDSGKGRLGEQAQNKSGLKLNPRWVETLMGLEPGTVSIEPCTPTTCTNRTDELRMLGNGVVPQTCAVAVRVLMERLNSFNKSQQRTHNE
jgi:hypothetical protein